MGRTSLVLDDELVQECQRVTGIRTRRALVDYALREVLRRGRQRLVLGLKGAIKWDGDLDAWRGARG